VPIARPPKRLRIVAAVGAALLAVACGPSPISTPASVSPSPTAPPTASVSPSSSATPASSSVGSSGSPGPTTATVPIDPGLLDLLPATVAGDPVSAVPDPSGTDDPTLVKTVARMVEAVVIDPASGDFAYASVIVLRPGVYDEAFFSSWRASFDTGACSQAGGVTGHRQARIGGRMTFVGECGGGVLTYHVRLANEDAIVSVSSLGPSHLGEQLLARLRL
jgi:hypothetical protein